MRHFASGSTTASTIRRSTRSFPTPAAPPIVSRRWRKCCTTNSVSRSEEHTSEPQSRQYLVCRLLLEKKKRCRSFPSRQRASCVPASPDTSNVSGRSVRETKIQSHRRPTIVALEEHACHSKQKGRPAAETISAREIVAAQSSVRRGGAPSCGNLRGAEEGAAQSIPAASRSRNRLTARSSFYRNIAILAVRPTGMMLVEAKKNCVQAQNFG